MRTETVTTETIDAKKLFSVLSDYQRGDFSVRMPDDQVGMAGKIYDALNDVIERNQRMAKELERLSTVVGKAGNIKQRASLPSAERRVERRASNRSTRWSPTWCSRPPRSRASSARSPRATCRRPWRSRSTTGR